MECQGFAAHLELEVTYSYAFNSVQIVRGVIKLRYQNKVDEKKSYYCFRLTKLLLVGATYIG